MVLTKVILKVLQKGRVKMRAKTLEKINKVLELQELGKTREEIQQELNIPNVVVFMNQKGYSYKDNKFKLKEEPGQEQAEGQLSMLESQQEQEVEVVQAEVIEDNNKGNTNSNTEEGTELMSINKGITKVLTQEKQVNKLLELIANADKILELLNNTQDIDTTTIHLTYDIRGSYQRTSFKVSEQILSQWSEFKNQWSEYKSQELISQALAEFMENHKK